MAANYNYYIIRLRINVWKSNKFFCSAVVIRYLTLDLRYLTILNLQCFFLLKIDFFFSFYFQNTTEGKLRYIKNMQLSLIQTVSLNLIEILKINTNMIFFYFKNFQPFISF